MILALLSVFACLALVIKLMFYTEHHRQDSRLIYRVLLYIVTVYVGREVILFLYNPMEPVSLLTTLFHLILLGGSFIIEPWHLPWNMLNDSDLEDQSSYRPSVLGVFLRQWFRSPRVHRGQAGNRGAEQSPQGKARTGW